MSLILHAYLMRNVSNAMDIITIWEYIVRNFYKMMKGNYNRSSLVAKFTQHEIDISFGV